MSDPKLPSVPTWALVGCALLLFGIWVVVLTLLFAGVIHPWQVQ
jgi:hypothetical protein